jgi:hypothetical protein
LFRIGKDVSVGVHFLAERLGSGDGERKTLPKEQIASEPLPASVLFALVSITIHIVSFLGSGTS